MSWRATRSLFQAATRHAACVCYLDRGVGAAIRRARTRLPGGGDNPAAIIRVPRERMVGGGIASSLVHEVGHQAAALLGLVSSLRPVLRAQRGDARAVALLAALDLGDRRRLVVSGTRRAWPRRWA